MVFSFSAKKTKMTWETSFVYVARRLVHILFVIVFPELVSIICISSGHHGILGIIQDVRMSLESAPYYKLS